MIIGQDCFLLNEYHSRSVLIYSSVEFIIQVVVYSEIYEMVNPIDPFLSEGELNLFGRRMLQQLALLLQCLFFEMSLNAFLVYFIRKVQLSAKLSIQPAQRALFNIFFRFPYLLQCNYFLLIRFPILGLTGSLQLHVKRNFLRFTVSYSFHVFVIKQFVENTRSCRLC